MLKVVERYCQNQDNKKLQDIFEVVLLKIFNSVNDNTNNTEQDWFYYALKKSNKFNIFNNYYIKDTAINEIKAFINFDNSATLINLEKVMNIFFKDGGYTITEGVGVVTIKVDNELFSSLLIDDKNNLLATHNGVNLKAVPSSKTNLPNEFNTLLQNFIPAGVKLNFIIGVKKI